MTLWLTADMHLSHSNIVRLCGRPFANVDEMNCTLLDRHNRLVAPEDTVLDLGDFCWTPAHVGAWLRRLNGRRVLVCGNHDRAWRGKSKGSAKWKRAYRAAGFAAAVDEIRFAGPRGERVCVNHFPAAGDSQHEDRFAQWRPRDFDMLLHGHCHEKALVTSGGKGVNVGVDRWNFAPVRAAEALGWLTTRADEMAALLLAAVERVIAEGKAE